MKYHIETYGCQMNVYDSQQMEVLLQAAGHVPVDSAEAAEILLLNTCAVRESAEQRIWGQLGRYKTYKERGSCRILALCGCMAQNHSEKVFKRAPHVDLVLGTGALHVLPSLLADLIAGRSQLMDVDFYEDSFLNLQSLQALRKTASEAPLQYPAFVSIMRGCNYRCTFCVVPRVRGREISRPPEDIYAEVQCLVERGYREITLIGQTVNSYRYEETDFADLLEKVASIKGLDRVRFMTSYPRNFLDKLIEVIAGHGNICEHIHLPVQSGSDRILRRMARRYTVGDYVDLCDRIRRRVPGVSLTTDLIVGFPGETEEDFEGTMSLMNHIRWDGSFIFKYSPREKTAAVRLPDPVPDSVVSERFQRILDLQYEVANEWNRQMVGSTVEILLEEVPRQNGKGAPRGEYKGRTRGNKMVVVHNGSEKHEDTSNRYQVGDLVPVRVVESRAYSFNGEFAG